MATVPDSRLDPNPFSPRPRRRIWGRLIVFAASLVLVNGVFGERGLTDGLRAGHEYAENQRDLEAIRRDNARLRDEIRRLRDDPETIEVIARGELGLLRPGEILVRVRELEK